jgi:glutaredoxin
MAIQTVRLWALSTCPWCRKAKQWLTANGVDFEFVDVDLLSDGEYDATIAELKTLAQSRAFPIVRIGDQVFVGYAPAKWAAALGIDP